MKRGRSGVLAIVLITQTALPAVAHAQTLSPSPASEPERAAARLDVIREKSLSTRRSTATAVLVAGVGSIVAGGLLLIPSGNDKAWRFAGIQTAFAGVVNTAVGTRALLGISSETRTWEASPRSKAERRTEKGYIRHLQHALDDERRESSAHALNLGLAFGYAALAGAAVVGSRLDDDHPNRWLGTGIALGAQAANLMVIDTIGMVRANHYHGQLLGELGPSVVLHTDDQAKGIMLGWKGRF